MRVPCAVCMWRSCDVMVIMHVPRVVADTRGTFAQPALYEAFGLTVVEAMGSGLPTFATNRGGPGEIVGHHGLGGVQVRCTVLWCVALWCGVLRVQRCGPDVQRVLGTAQWGHGGA